MLSNLMSDLVSKIKALAEFKQVEPYEGQFDEISEFLIAPPACFIELSAGQINPDGRQNTTAVNVSLYLITSHIKSKQPTSMLNLIDTLRNELVKQDFETGYLDYKGFDRAAIFQGFSSYIVNFEFSEV